MKTTQRRCFVSYAHEGVDRDTLDYFLFILRDALQEDIHLAFDQQLKYGADFAEFMALLDEVDAVIILLTPSYRRKVVERQGGVYEEYRRIWARFSDQKVEGNGYIVGNRPASFEIIPVLFSGSMNDATPPELKNLNQLDLTGLRAIRKQTGEFQVPTHVQQIYGSKLQKLISDIRTVSTVNSPAHSASFQVYYDHFFVDLKAGWDRESNVGHNHLDSLFVKTSVYYRVKNQVAYFVIGRKGSGKSTLTQVLPLIDPERFRESLKINTDEFNLETLYSLYSNQQFRSDSTNIISRYQAFELTWEALLVLETMEKLSEFFSTGNLNNLQKQLMKPIISFMDNLKGSDLSASPWRTVDFFNYAFSSMMRFVNDCINGARQETEYFLTDIGVRFNREQFLNFTFTSDVLKQFRRLIQSLDRKFLVTLDGFDTAFDSFRRNVMRTFNEEELQRRVLFEIDWLRSLLGLAMLSRSRNDDYFYRLLDFCFAVPKDRFMEVIRIERDSYRHLNRWCAINWSGIELAILLRKRLEVLAGVRTRDASPRERLEEILKHKQYRNIPIDIEFEYNGRVYKIPLFMYVLRHTFWRPRDVLIYYAGILALADNMKRWSQPLTSDAVRKCVKATTRRVIESEFLNELRSTVVNIDDITGAFRRKPIVLDYDTLRRILCPLQFKFAAAPVNNIGIIDKLCFLYEVGFLGVRVERHLRERLGLSHEYAFYFNEGFAPVSGIGEEDLRDYQFVIHPIFSEYLRLDVNEQELTLRFSWEYLHQSEASLSFNPGI
jgi:hypothetical protein